MGGPIFSFGEDFGPKLSFSGPRDKKIVHVNWLKFAHCVDTCDRDSRLKRKARWRSDSLTVLNDDETADIKIGAFPLVYEDRQRVKVLPNRRTPVPGP
jgi:hypothetical protein